MKTSDTSLTTTLGGLLKPLAVFLHLWPKQPTALDLARAEFFFVQREVQRQASKAERLLCEHGAAKVSEATLRTALERIKRDITTLEGEQAADPTSTGYKAFMRKAITGEGPLPDLDGIPHTRLGQGPKPIAPQPKGTP